MDWTDDYLGMNSHIFMREDGDWEVQGRFSDAIKGQEATDWALDEKGRPCLSLLAVCSVQN